MYKFFENKEENKPFVVKAREHMLAGNIDKMLISFKQTTHSIMY